MGGYALELPQVIFSLEDWDKNAQEIIVNLNDHLELDILLRRYRVTHRRIIPEIQLTSPTGTIKSFTDPYMDEWEIVYSSKGCKARLTYR